MRKFPFVLLVAFFVVAFAPAAHALTPTITLETGCSAAGDAIVAWTVVPYGPANSGDHNNVQVEVSVDGGPWTLVGTGGLTAANNWTFTGSAVLPPGALSVRGRTRAVGPWANGFTNEIYTYAILTIQESSATDYAVPTDCEPPPPPPPPPSTNPGTGTPGYWKNHPEEWPVDDLAIGGVTYTLDQLLDILSTPTAGDVTYIMARAVISAELNGLIGNDTSCIDGVLEDGQAWLAAHPIGSKVKGRDAAWTAGSVVATELDEYNNGLLCAPHRE